MLAHPLIFGIKDANLWVGIENGIYQVGAEGNQRWVDAACIVVLRKLEGGAEEVVLWSDEIEIPADFPKGPNVRVAAPHLALGRRNTRILQGEWSVLKDPHREITQGKRPRASFLADTLLAWKNAA
jgi:hypothetical protein